MVEPAVMMSGITGGGEQLSGVVDTEGGWLSEEGRAAAAEQSRATFVK